MTSHDDEFADAYTGLAEAHDDSRWAFGTGFDDPLEGVDTTIPDGVDPAELAALSLGLADDALVLGQRLVEWAGHAPELEEEVALANVALDLFGQARLLYARAAAADPGVVPALPEDSPVPVDDRLAFFRDQAGFRTVHLVEQPNGDFAATMARLLVFSAWRHALLDGLCAHPDPVLAAIGGKGVKEVAYHVDHAGRWVVVLAQGTDESRRRMSAGLAALLPYVGELAVTGPEAWRAARPRLDAVLREADLLTDEWQQADAAAGGRNGRGGRHTEHLAHLLDEMQVVARAHPQGRW